MKRFASSFGASDLAVLKDPRICRFVPLWISVFNSMAIKPLFVFLVRSPLEVAASLQARNALMPFTLGGVSEAAALLLWLRHFIDAERDTRGEPRVFVSYEQVLGDWRGTSLASAANSISLGQSGRKMPSAPWASSSPARLRHHVLPDEDLDLRKDIPDWVRMAYRWARTAASGGSPDVAELDHITDALHVADATFMPIMQANADDIVALARNAEQLAVEKAERYAEKAQLLQRPTNDCCNFRRRYLGMRKYVRPRRGDYRTVAFGRTAADTPASSSGGHFLAQIWRAVRSRSSARCLMARCPHVPESSAAPNRWDLIDGLSAEAVEEAAVVSGQRILRLVAVGADSRHALGARFGDLAPSRNLSRHRLGQGRARCPRHDRARDSFDPHTGNPSNYGVAQFDLAARSVVNSTGDIIASGVDAAEDDWVKVWVDLRSKDGQIFALIGLLEGRNNQHVFTPAGQSVIFGGFEISPPRPCKSLCAGQLPAAPNEHEVATIGELPPLSEVLPPARIGGT